MRRRPRSSLRAPLACSGSGCTEDRRARDAAQPSAQRRPAAVVWRRSWRRARSEIEFRLQRDDLHDLLRVGPVEHVVDRPVLLEQLQLQRLAHGRERPDTGSQSAASAGPSCASCSARGCPSSSTPARARPRPAPARRPSAVDERRHLEQRHLLHLVARGAHKVVDGHHLGRQRAADALDARDGKGAPVRLARTARRSRERASSVSEAIEAARARSRSPPCFPSPGGGVAPDTRKPPPKAALATSTAGAPAGVGRLVVLVVVVDGPPGLVVGARLSRRARARAVAIAAAAGARRRRGRSRSASPASEGARRGGLVKLVARAQRARGHRNGRKAAAGGGRHLRRVLGTRGRRRPPPHRGAGALPERVPGCGCGACCAACGAGTCCPSGAGGTDSSSLSCR